MFMFIPRRAKQHTNAFESKVATIIRSVYTDRGNASPARKTMDFCVWFSTHSATLYRLYYIRRGVLGAARCICVHNHHRMLFMVVAYYYTTGEIHINTWSLSRFTGRRIYSFMLGRFSLVVLWCFCVWCLWRENRIRIYVRACCTWCVCGVFVVSFVVYAAKNRSLFKYRYFYL